MDTVQNCDSYKVCTLYQASNFGVWCEPVLVLVVLKLKCTLLKLFRNQTDGRFDDFVQDAPSGLY
jgi:hypothetical protein